MTGETVVLDVGAAQIHEVDFGAKHVVALKFPPLTSRKIADETCRKMRKLLAEWEKSKLPFLVVGLLDGIEIRFEKKPVVKQVRRTWD